MNDSEGATGASFAEPSSADDGWGGDDIIDGPKTFTAPISKPRLNFGSSIIVKKLSFTQKDDTETIYFKQREAEAKKAAEEEAAAASGGSRLKQRQGASAAAKDSDGDLDLLGGLDDGDDDMDLLASPSGPKGGGNAAGDEEGEHDEDDKGGKGRKGEKEKKVKEKHGGSVEVRGPAPTLLLCRRSRY